jgi:hypothetical protein
VLNKERVFRLLLDRTRNALPVFWTEYERSQDQQVKGAL